MIFWDNQKARMMSEKLIGLTETGKEKLLKQADFWSSSEKDYTGFNVHFFDPSLISPNNFIQKAHQAAYQAWQDSLKGNRLPDRKSLDPLSMPKALGNLILLEPEENNGKQDFRFRLYGTNIRQGLGKDMTGKYVSELGTRPATATVAQYVELLQRKQPFYAEHNAPPEVSSLIRWCRLALPYYENSENGDESITRILVCNIPIDQPLGS